MLRAVIHLAIPIIWIICLVAITFLPVPLSDSERHERESRDRGELPLAAT